MTRMPARELAGQIGRWDWYIYEKRGGNGLYLWSNDGITYHCGNDQKKSHWSGPIERFGEHGSCWTFETKSKFLQWNDIEGKKGLWRLVIKTDEFTTDDSLMAGDGTGRHWHCRAGGTYCCDQIHNDYRYVRETRFKIFYDSEGKAYENASYKEADRSQREPSRKGTGSGGKMAAPSRPRSGPFAANPRRRVLLLCG